MPYWFPLLCQFSILAFAMLAGVFLAFSDFLMRSFAATGAASAVQTMQTINREVFRYVFMILFLGMAPVSAMLAVYAAFALSGPSAALIALSGAAYLIGGFGVTVVFNVPLNDALAVHQPGAETADRFWSETYLPRWTVWNSVRTAACALAAALLLAGLGA